MYTLPVSVMCAVLSGQALLQEVPLGHAMSQMQTSTKTSVGINAAVLMKLRAPPALYPGKKPYIKQTLNCEALMQGVPAGQATTQTLPPRHPLRLMQRCSWSSALLLFSILARSLTRRSPKKGTRPRLAPGEAPYINWTGIYVNAW